MSNKQHAALAAAEKPAWAKWKQALARCAKLLSAPRPTLISARASSNALGHNQCWHQSSCFSFDSFCADREPLCSSSMCCNTCSAHTTTFSNKLVTHFSLLPFKLVASQQTKLHRGHLLQTVWEVCSARPIIRQQNTCFKATESVLAMQLVMTLICRPYAACISTLTTPWSIAALQQSRCCVAQHPSESSCFGLPTDCFCSALLNSVAARVR